MPSDSLSHDMTMVPRLLIYTVVQVPIGLALYACTDSIVKRYWPVPSLVSSPSEAVMQTGEVVVQLMIAGAFYSIAHKTLGGIVHGYHDPTHGLGFMMMAMLASPGLTDRTKAVAQYVDKSVQAELDKMFGKVSQSNGGGVSAEVRKGNIGDAATGNKIVQPRTQQQLANPMIY